MLTSARICLTLILVSITAITSSAQYDTATPHSRPTALTVTGAASDQTVRFTAPASVVQIRLEVYDPAGKKLFDNEVRGGNVLDWHLQDGQAERLPGGTYLCIVTVKSLAGKINQRIASITVEASAARLQPINGVQLTAQQSQAVGPVEEDSALTVVQEGDPQSGTLIAHNGEEGQISRTAGALSFRVGDFLRGKDAEQMRLTAEGSLGIGTASPQAKLDVNGTIRAAQGIVFPDGSVQLSAARKTFGSDSLRPGQSPTRRSSGQGDDAPYAPATSGTGMTGTIPKWQDGPNGVLTDSIIVESPCPYGFCIGIGTTPPANTPFRLDVRGNNRFSGSNVSFYLTGESGNEWVFQTVDSDGRLRLFDNSGGAGERFSIARSGNVGIGTFMPTAKLDVAGAINTSTQYNIGGNRVLSIAGNNVFVGLLAGASHTTGVQNAFFGHQAGRLNTTGTSNSFFGDAAGNRNTTGGGNTFLGESAGIDNSTGGNNTFVGQRAGASNTTEINNVFIGSDALGTVEGITNATAIGYRATVSQSNSLVLGSINQINGAFADVSVGIGTTAPKAKLHIQGGDVLVSSPGQGIILKSPDGSVCRRLSIDNTGTIVTSVVSCP